MVLIFFILASGLVNSAIGVGKVRHIADEDIKAFTEELLTKDQNNAGKLVTMNLQGKSPYGSTKDEAPNDLIKMDKSVLEIPTIKKILPLYDNYDADANHDEVVTPEERKEELAFLDAVLSTPSMQLTKKFLQDKLLVPKTDEAFKNFMKDMWFTVFSRGNKKKGSSAFEHIFLGEMKKGEVSGLHNWLFFQHQEKKKAINYIGWVKNMEFSGKRGGVLKVRYTWNNVNKPAGTMFYGTSPEFEMAIYTVCFVTRKNDKCNIVLSGKPLQVLTYAFDVDGKSVISSAYPNLV
ncbi:poly(U)-specific endoribonuclease homolog [Cimex lectularius]|uniref:EndoU domain-containing protein n=1 Tax=Cimex lectularius TaxID=79782 RepID=A0A8I6RVI3_CIMLE|nr:poly(U)-specific endoribonuclease homolog [Cimex lectularius]